jgi:hypothetical protein
MTGYMRYPLVKKALGEQAAIFDGTAEGVPAQLATATSRALALIDENVDVGDETKECLLTVAVLMHCPPYLALKSDRFAADYHPHVQAMLDTHTKSPGVTAANTDLVQVYSAMFVANAENLQKSIEATTAADRPWLRDIRDSLRDYAEDRGVFVDAIAPRLRAIEDKLIETTLATLDARLAPLPKPPKAPKPPRR